MSKVICNDIYNRPIIGFNFNPDGTVEGILDEKIKSTFGDDITPNVGVLSRTCCVNNGFNYDNISEKCYYRELCINQELPENIGIYSQIKILQDEIDELYKEAERAKTEEDRLIIIEEIRSKYEEIDILLSQLKFNDLKLMFNSQGNSPVIFDIEGSVGDLSPQQIDSCNNKISEYTVNINDLKDELAIKTDNLETISISIDNIINQIQDLENEKEVLIIQKNDAVSTQNDSLVIELQEDIEQINDRITELNNTLNNLNNQKNILENRISDINIEIEDFTNQLEEIQNICTPEIPSCNLKLEFDYLWGFDLSTILNCGAGDGSLLNQLSQSLNVLNFQKNINYQRIEVFMNEKEGISGEISNINNLIKVYKNQLDSETDPVRIFEIETEIDNLNKQTVSLIERYKEIEEEIKILYNKNNSLTKQIDAITGQINSIQSIGNLKNSLENIKFYFTIDKNVYNEEYGFYTWETVYEEKFFEIGDLVEHIDLSGKTGIYMSGNDNDYNIFLNNIKTQLGENCDLVTESTFKSNWLKLSRTINDPEIISKIVNERINFSIRISYPTECEYNILIDNIKMEKVCEKTDSIEILIDKPPKFDLERVVDNKKSWVNINSGYTREYQVYDRKTEYNVINDKAVINSKEIDLELSPANAIEYDVIKYLDTHPELFELINDNIKKINKIISSLEGELYDIKELYNYRMGLYLDKCDLSPETEVCVTYYNDLRLKYLEELIEKYEYNIKYEKIKKETYINPSNYVINNLILTELIDVKSRKSISSYPVLKDLYYRYLYPTEYFGTGSTSNQYTYYGLIEFSDLINTYWYDLIEQMVPATSVWDSVYKFSNTKFDDNKFKYRPYSLIYCLDDKPDDNIFNGGSTNESEIIIEDLSNKNDNPYPECYIPNDQTKVCSLIGTVDYGFSCEYTGNVYITGVGISNIKENGDNIVVQENIT